MKRLTIIIASVFSPVMALAGVSSGGSTMKSASFTEANASDRQGGGGMAASELALDRAGVGGRVVTSRMDATAGEGTGGGGVRPSVRVELNDVDVVRFNELLSSGEISFDVGVFQNGRIHGIQSFSLKPSEFSSDERAYLQALRDSAASGKVWKAVIEAGNGSGTLADRN